MFFDTHVHFDDFAEDGTLHALLERAEASCIHKMIAVGGSDEANALALRLHGEYSGRIYAAVGYDRHMADSDCDIAGLRKHAESPAVVAIGETGLDYFYEPDQARAQQTLFAHCLETASQTSKPIIVHTRDADDDTLSMLRDYSSQWKGGAGRQGVIHCFTRDEKMARALLDLGFYLSVSGIVTFNNAGSLREVAQYIPADRLLLETDSPYLAPIPHRGKRNEPSFMADTAKRLAEVRGEDVEYLAGITTENAIKLFGLEDR